MVVTSTSDWVKVNCNMFEAAPPGLVTITGYEPGGALARLAGIVKLSEFPLVTVVAAAMPLIEATEGPPTLFVVRKFAPLTATAKPAVPAGADEGFSKVMAGARMEKIAPGETVPSGCKTVTVAVPGATIRLAGTSVVRCVLARLAGTVKLSEFPLVTVVAAE